LTASWTAWDGPLPSERQMFQQVNVTEIWPEGSPRDAWHSFDATPWLHPWLTRANLEAMREASAAWREEAHVVVERHSARLPDRFAFVGNIANGMYLRAKSLNQTNMKIDVFGLCGDNSVFSDARWEEYDGVLPQGGSYLSGEKTFLQGIKPKLEFEQLTASAQYISMPKEELPTYVNVADFARFHSFFCHLPGLNRLQAYDALFTTQNCFLGHLAGKPYVATQMGGDIWLEGARDDVLGRLQRTGFRRASCVLVSNPWSYAHARRYGFNNLIYLPLTLNEEDYSPGLGRSRAEWEATGGDFFVLTAARSDNYYKGTDLGLRGFAQFSAKHSNARLVVVGWGNDLEATRARLGSLGIADTTIFLPVSGKRRMVDYLRSADCLLDQFRLGYYGATALEAAGCGLPIVMRIEHSQYDAICRTGAPPFLNADSSNDVADALESLISDQERRTLSARLHRDWFLGNHSGRAWARDYEAILSAVALGHHFSFETSPLNDELSAAERLYHAEQLAAAPEFPNYERSSESFIDLRGHLAKYPEVLEIAAHAAATSNEVRTRLTLVQDHLQQIEDQQNRIEDMVSSVQLRFTTPEEVYLRKLLAPLLGVIRLLKRLFSSLRSRAL
jgi:glycosyltransferase involved in cell wall biosynthesis